MPPKIKITKEEIVQAAVDIVRQQGASALNARTVATVLGCSTQPVFSNFATMEDLRVAVMTRANAICRAYIQRETESGEFPPYKAGGMAYIRFAKEEKELFTLLYMSDRAKQPIVDDVELLDDMEAHVNRNTGLKGSDAKLFHMEMWVAVHGIAAMLATGYLDLEREVISRMITDIYRGLCQRHGKEA